MADMFDTKRKTTSFAIGETVRLKSGGPDMSVVVSHSGQTHCVWFGDRPYHQSFGGCFPDEEFGEGGALDQLQAGLRLRRGASSR